MWEATITIVLAIIGTLGIVKQCDQQHGFQQHRSCETQLIVTVHDFAKCLTLSLMINFVLT